jgi:hypothetical protein
MIAELCLMRSVLNVESRQQGLGKCGLGSLCGAFGLEICRTSSAVPAGRHQDAVVDSNQTQRGASCVLDDVDPDLQQILALRLDDGTDLTSEELEKWVGVMAFDACSSSVDGP